MVRDSKPVRRREHMNFEAILEHQDTANLLVQLNIFRKKVEVAAQETKKWTKGTELRYELRNHPAIRDLIMVTVLKANEGSTKGSPKSSFCFYWDNHWIIGTEKDERTQKVSEVEKLSGKEKNVDALANEERLIESLVELLISPF